MIFEIDLMVVSLFTADNYDPGAFPRSSNEMQNAFSQCKFPVLSMCHQTARLLPKIEVPSSKRLASRG